MPISSSALVSEASRESGRGLRGVALGFQIAAIDFVSLFMAGRIVSLSESSASGSSDPSTYARRKPGNSIVLPETTNTAPSPSRVTRTMLPRASAIWLAMVRFQIMSNRRNWSQLNSPSSVSGSLKGGPRDESLRALPGRSSPSTCRSRGCGVRNSSPYCDRTRSAGRIDRHLREVRAIGSHVGDVTVFIQLCAISIVRLAPKPSLRLASCCSVLVVNGAAGRLV